jgi:molybdopterin/thiamine biosynthesis adenylyltransferase
MSFAGKSVLIAGAGAIGCEVIKCLAFEGATRMTIVDYDVVSTTNLHRQALFRAADCGQLKAECAVRWVKQFVERGNQSNQSKQNDKSVQNPTDCDIRAVVARVESLSINDLRAFDVVVSALDDARAMRLLSQRCVAARVAVVACNSNSRLGTAVRHWTPSRTPCFDCRYPDATLDLLPKTELSCSSRFRSRSVAEAAALAALWLADALSHADRHNLDAFYRALFHDRVQDYIQTSRIDNIMRVLPLDAPVVRNAALRATLRAAIVSTGTNAPREPNADHDPNLTERVCELLEHTVLDVPSAAALFLGALQVLFARPNASESAAWLFDKDDIWHRAFVGAAAALQCYASHLAPVATFEAVAHVAPVAAASPTAAATAGALGVLEALRAIRLAGDAKGDVWSAPAFDEPSDLLLRRQDVMQPLPGCASCAPCPLVSVSRASCTVGQLRALLADAVGSAVEAISYGAAFQAVLVSPYSDDDDDIVNAQLVGAALTHEVESIAVEFVDSAHNMTVRVSFVTESGATPSIVMI